ncbi:MAG: restriction endonuclease subunit S [Bacilli bacterium]|jgi:type I restriction enzyme S subunit|nr:restriction endonuclease subunit S [Bacilli bacterium]
MSETTFDTTWKKSKIAEFCQTFSGGTPNRRVKKYYVDGTIPWIKSGELNSKIIVGTEESITELALKETSAKMVRKNDLLLALYGATAGVIGVSKIEAAINQAILCVRPDETCLVEFLRYNLENQMKTIVNRLTQGGQPNLNANIVKATQVLLPTLPEQKKIAEILSTWDEAITKYEDLIAGAEKYRQSIISKILSKKYISMSRSDEWKEVPLGTLIEQVSEKTTINNQYPILTSSRKGIFLQEDYFKKSVASSNNIGYKIIRNGEFTFRAMSDDGTFKFNRLLEHEIGIVSPAYSVFKAVHVEPRFLDVYMNSHIFTKEIAKASQGGTRLSLKYVALAKFKITVPNKKRQVEIANLNDDIEHYIASLKGYKTQLILQKQGLMQRLLTGKVRVKLD